VTTPGGRAPEVAGACLGWLTKRACRAAGVPADPAEIRRTQGWVAVSRSLAAAAMTFVTVLAREIRDRCPALMSVMWTPAAGPLVADDYIVEDNSPPQTPARFAAVESIGQAGGPDRAVAAQCLRTGHVAGQFSEEQVRIGAARQRSRHTSPLAGAPARPHRSAG